MRAGMNVAGFAGHVVRTAPCHAMRANLRINTSDTRPSRRQPIAVSSDAMPSDAPRRRIRRAGHFVRVGIGCSCRGADLG